MPVASTNDRVLVDGKFFRLKGRKFFVKGLAYGPFAANAHSETFVSPEQTRSDFAQARELGANVLRIYHLPPPWWLDLAAEFEIKAFVDIPWPKNHCFLDSGKSREEAKSAVRAAVRGVKGHPALFAWSLVNEVPPDVVRWSGSDAINEFLDELADIAKQEDPGCLVTFGNFPPTEFLHPQKIDFVTFNVYLHGRKPYENYLSRLQMHADSLPLLLGEFGVDSIREGETEKSAILEWGIEVAFRQGLAGTILFSFTDDWVMGGRQVVDWSMGLTTRERKPKESFHAVQRQWRQAPYFPLAQEPKVSVVVACYNGAKTLRPCLDSLTRLNYPNYEVILVDDGSRDATAEIARRYPEVRYIHQGNHGLSVARNTGIAAATGEVIAFTDADCRADEDWLYYLINDLTNSRFAAIGGPNYLPPEDSPVAAAVMASPGGPSHVMLTDRLAEHIPGCNMVFYKWALEEIDGFDPIFRKAGDDVDICWRLQQRGLRIGFSPSAFVWHYRRSTVAAYLKQQHGYGEAESLLIRKHPEYFNIFGGSVWKGHIYNVSKPGVIIQRPVIYHGIFASGFFQTLYSAEPALGIMFCTSLEYHALITLPLLILSVPFRFLLPVGLATLLVSMGICVAAAVQAHIPKDRRRIWSRPLVAVLFFLQPIVRGLARYQGRMAIRSLPPSAIGKLPALERTASVDPALELLYWSDQPIDRVRFVQHIIACLDKDGWPNKADTGWCEYDLEIFGSSWTRLHLTTVTEETRAGARMFRCRLKPNWSLSAKMVFFATLAFELLIIGVVAVDVPWLWMILLTMPLFAWFFEQEKRNVQRLIGAYLDQIARDLGLTKIDLPDNEVPPRLSGPPAPSVDKTGQPVAT